MTDQTARTLIFLAALASSVALIITKNSEWVFLVLLLSWGVSP